MKTFYLFKKAFVLFIFLFPASVCLAQRTGANIYNPIDAGVFPKSPFSDTENNNPSNGFGNDLGNSSDDIFYKVVLNTSGDLTLSTCTSSFDTYIFLLDNTGSVLASNDDNNVCAGTLQAGLKMHLASGTYYIASEGYGSNYGNITTDISFNLDQATNNGTDPGYTAVVDSLFQHMDKSRITTGILYDRAFPLAKVNEFNSSVSDTSVNKYFMQAYSEMYRAAYDQSNWLTTDDVKSIALGKYLDSSPQIPIALANYKYNVIDTNAVANGQILQIDSMYYDASATSNPYITLQTFIASPLIDSIKSSNNTVLFNFSPELTFNKSNTPIISLNVNFGDGGPDQAIAMNAENSVAVNYSSSGYKILKFVAGLSDGSTSTTYAAVKVNVDDSGGLAPSGPTCNATDVFDKFTSDLIFQGYDENTATTGTGNVKIFYATNGNCDKILRKPIIILDGFDPGDNRKVDQLYDDYLNNRNKGGTLADDLRAQGFDLVLLNFPQYRIGTKTVGRVSVPIMRDGGADYIERNALILIKLIKYVNTNKQGTEKLIVIGPSMGGLISRYALKYMEQHNDPHQTKLWISFDSPHQGANIPIGDQWFLDYYAKKLDSEELKSNRDGKIGSTAAKQMLLHHYLANSESPIGAPGFRNRFVDMLNTIGFPSGDPGQPFRKVALIDGSLGGVEVNSAGQKGFTFDIRRRKTTFFFIRWRSLTVASARMYFSPSYGGNAQPVLDASYLFGSKTYRASTPSFTSGYDVAPGGKFDTQGVLYDEGNGTVQNVFFGLIAFQARFYSVVRDHSFISTKSALAFTGSNQNLSEDISTRSLVCTGETPFDSYYGDFNQNRDHVELWKDAISWVENEIKGSPQPPPVRNVSYSIAGPASICNTQSYSVSNLPAGTNVSWSASPTNTVNISVNNNVATLTPIGNGSINLSATVTSACGSTIVTIPVGVGTPPTVTSISATMSGACRNGGYQDWYLQATPSNPNATNWRWTVDNPSSGYYYIQNPNSASTFVTVSGGGGVSVTYTDPCGNTSLRNGVTIWSPCGRAGSIVSYPNPANNEMTVQYATASPSPQTSAATLSAGAGTKTLNSFSVELYNDKGKVLRYGKTGNGNQNVVLSTADIPNGNYFLHVIDGKEVIKKQVVIQH